MNPQISIGDKVRNPYFTYRLYKVVDIDNWGQLHCEEVNTGVSAVGVLFVKFPEDNVG